MPSCDFANGAGKRETGIVTSSSRSPGPQIHSSWRCVKRAQLHVPATSMISASRELEYVYLPRLQLAQRRKCACLFRHSRATLFEPPEMSSHCFTKTVSLSKYTSYYGLGMVTRASPVLSHRKRLAPGHRPFSSPRFGFWVRLNPSPHLFHQRWGKA